MAKFNINAMFTNGSDELNVYSTSIDEDSDSIKIITNIRSKEKCRHNLYWQRS